MAKHFVQAILCAFSLLLLAGCGREEQKPAAQQAQQAQQQPAPGQQALAGATVQLPSFATLVKQRGATVVNITATHTVKQGTESPPGAEGDPLAEFFRRFMQPPGPEEYQARGVGSGFIVSADGFILTNAHVVAESEEVTVKLTTKREYKAKLIGADPRTDVALLKIDASNLPVVPIGNAEKLEVGEWVAAIGAPFGFENSVTAGIVSAKGRSLPDESYVPFIQTDVAVNPGNSGGPLFNMQGEVVGINSAIYSRTGGFQGVSFAIPIDIAMDVVQQLRTTGKVTRGKIGVLAQELTIDLAASFGLKEPAGALVASVEKGSPAEKAGIVPGDVILSFGGKPVQSSADLARLVGNTRPGTKVPLEVWRKGASQKLELAVGELKPEQVAEQKEPQQMPVNRAGLVLSELPPQLRDRLKVDRGLLVRKASGPAQRAGMEAGDVILAVNDRPVTDLASFEQQLARGAGGTIALLVKRGAESLYVPLKLERG
jgi:serine protease Do